MAAADLRDELLCSICMNIYTDPVTLRCGHNFCRDCIDGVQDTDGGYGDYSCPECRATFRKNPPLQRNITLCNVVENVLSTQSHQEEITGIRCSYCIHSPVPAVRSCLHCEASLCDKHLRVHSKAAEHVLTDPSTSLEKWKCSIHKRILEYYCTEDAACICVYCSAGEHWGHRVEMLDEASERKKKTLKIVFQRLNTKREKAEEEVQSLEERRRKAKEKVAGEFKRVSALCTDIRRRVDDLEKKVLNEISRQKDLVTQSLSDVIHQLEIKKDELSRKMGHIEELCNMADPLTVLQEPDTGDLCDPEEDGGDEDTRGHDGGDEATGGHDGGDEDTGGHDGGDEDTGGHDGGDEDTGGHDGGDEGRHDKTHDVDVDVITGMLHAGFFDIITYLQLISPAKPEEMRPQATSPRSLVASHTQYIPISSIIHKGDNIIARTRGIYVQDPADILLDVNTANNNLLISNDLKTATWTRITKNRPETAERFQDHPQVMSRRGFTSGRHYWDVEINVSGRWRVGMCYPSIDRRGRQSLIGDNNKSWSLHRGWVNNTQYSAKHGSEVIQLPHQISTDRVRICLDYEAGQLSFYELCDPIRHLHTFTAAFTEPLHAVLCVWEGSIKNFGAAVRNHRLRRNLPSDW